jgi:hypothetical protein
MDKNIFELNRLMEYSNDEIIKEIIRVDNIINKNILTKREFDNYSHVHSSTIIKKYGNWKTALEKANLGNKYSGKTIEGLHRNQFSEQYTDDDILNMLKEISKNKGTDIICQEDFNNYSTKFGIYELKKRFGNFKNAVEAAGLKISAHGKRYTDNECYENLLTVWTFYKKAPTYKEMKIYPSIVGPKAYIVRWGSWVKALQSFIREINFTNGAHDIKTQKVKKDIKNEKLKLPSEERRDIPIGIRFNVLKRDNYKCKICGRSPATDFNVKLHVDHIIAFAKGGRTIIDNLQTLCQDCNIGKSDKEL